MHDVIYGTAHRRLRAQVKSRVLARLAVYAQLEERVERAEAALAEIVAERDRATAQAAQREFEITQALASVRAAFETERVAREDAERHASALVGTKTFRYTAALRRSYGRLLRARSKSTTETPVLLLVFNRPETTARVFTEITRARPRRLLIAADGPRPDQPGEAEKCAAVRAIVESVGWECEVSRDYSDVNLGLARRFATGLSWAFEQVEEAIILEDDCLPHPSFFKFCGELLEKYRDDERVMTICGDNYLFGRKRFPHSYFFHHIPGWYGWATWRRAFQHYDFSMTRWPELRKTTFLEQHLQDAEAVEYWRKMFDWTHSGAVGTWDSQRVFGALSPAPAGALVVQRAAPGGAARAARSAGSPRRLAHLRHRGPQVGVGQAGEERCGKDAIFPAEARCRAAPRRVVGQFEVPVAVVVLDRPADAGSLGGAPATPP